MSIRVTLCFVFVIGFSIYAWRNWFVSLCASIMLMAVIEHPDMPRTIAGIQGLNPWNILALNVVLAWWAHRRRDMAEWDLPGYLNWLFLLYLAVLLISFLRLVVNPDRPADESLGSLVSEHFINCFKWLLPGVMLYEGCRTRQKVVWATLTLLSVYLLLAIQVIRWMPLSVINGGGQDLAIRANKITLNEIGFHRVNLSMMLAGASWAMLSTLGIARTFTQKLVIFGSAMLAILGQALTGGRMGYVTWAVVGVMLCVVRWRKLLPLIPAAAIAVVTLVPGVSKRMFYGFASSEGPIVSENDTYEMTSGRSLIWPYVIDKIKESPAFGYGREAMATTGLKDWLWQELGESFPHPHNMYLQCLLDNGLVGFFLVIPLFGLLLLQGLKLLLNRDDPVVTMVGGVACSLLMALLVAGMGSQTIYPREGSVGMWAAIGVMLRVSVELRRAQENGTELFAEEGEAFAPEVEEASIAQPA